MSYAIHPGEAPGPELARIIARQAQRLREAGLALEDADAEERALFVHKARVRTKKIRAALRLGRALLGEKAFRRENRWWRDAARGLSGLRDLSARLDALAAVRSFLEPELGRTTTIRLQAAFERQRAAVESASANADAVKAFCELVAARDPPTADMFDVGDAADIARALGEGYRAARDAMKVAVHVRSAEALHDWRKRAKAHALQMRLAQRLFPDVIAPRLEPARDFAEALGGLQDIEVLSQALKDAHEDRVLAALDARRSELEVGALASGRALFAMKAKAWTAQLEAARDTADGAPGESPQPAYGKHREAS